MSIAEPVKSPREYFTACMAEGLTSTEAMDLSKAHQQALRPTGDRLMATSACPACPHLAHEGKCGEKIQYYRYDQESGADIPTVRLPCPCPIESTEDETPLETVYRSTNDLLERINNKGDRPWERM